MENDNDQIARYTGLVRAIAKRYPLPEGWERADIEQEGMIGLWNATKRYDPDGLHRNYPFPTVASFAIKTQIRKALRAATGAEPPEVEEPDISEQPTIVLPLPIRAPAWMLGRDTQPLPALELSEMTPDPAPSVEEQVMARLDGLQVSTVLESALLLLSEHQRAIIVRRYGLSGDGACWTLEEIGQLLGRHRSNIYRQQVKALTILRAHLGETRDGQLLLIDLEEKRQQQRTRKRATAA
jgi:RNA polymerase sigma factor (sigma-70 family)